MDKYQYWLTVWGLLYCSVSDLRKRSISRRVILIYLALALLGYAAALAGYGMDGYDIESQYMGLDRYCRGLSALIVRAGIGAIPGMICLFLSFLSRQSLGLGDSLLITVCGISMGFSGCLQIIITAFFCAGIWAVILLVFHRAGRKKEFPFIPFLFLGVVLLGVGGG